MSDRAEIAGVLASSLNLVKPLRHIFRDQPVKADEVIDALEVLLDQEIENAATVLAERERLPKAEALSAPSIQGLDLFEQYEADGSLLVVTSDRSALRLEPGDVIVRRAWATAAELIEINRATTEGTAS